MKKKILFIDTWTRGLKYFYDFTKYFNDENTQFILIHASSFGYDKNIPLEFLYKNKIKVLDLKIFKFKYDFNQIIELLKPQVVVFLSVNSILQKNFNKIALYKRIKTINLAHSQISVINLTDSYYKKKIIVKIITIIKNTHKLIRYFIINFNTSINLNLKIFKSYSQIIIELFYKLFNNSFYVTDDMKTNLNLIYNKYDFPIYKHIYHAKKENTLIIGNTDILNNINLKKVNKFKYDNEFQKKNYIIYIETGLSGSDKFFGGHKKYLNYILEIESFLKKNNYKLYFKNKPHSKFSNSKWINHVKHMIINDKFIYSNLNRIKSVISEPSNYTLNLMFLGFPTFILDTYGFKKNFYGRIFINYPNSHVVTDKNDFIKDIPKIDEKKFNYWKNNYFPMPFKKVIKNKLLKFLDLN